MGHVRDTQTKSSRRAVRRVHKAARTVSWGDRDDESVDADWRMFPDEIDEIDHDGETRLTRAILDAQMNTVQRLLAAGASVHATNRLGHSPMWVAIARDNGDAIRLLLRAGDALDMHMVGQGGPPLVRAVRAGQEEAVQTLLECGAQVDIHVSGGMTPLLFAAFGRVPNLVRLLLAAGANKDTCSDCGASALLLAAAIGDLPTLHILLGVGLDPNKSNLVGTTPLMAAAQGNRIEGIGILVDAGASVDACDEEGTSALMLAAEYGHHDVVRALCELGADIRLQNKFGTTAEKLAIVHQHQKCRDILEAVREQEQLDRALVSTRARDPDVGVPGAGRVTAGASAGAARRRCRTL